MSEQPAPVPYGTRIHHLAEQRGDATAIIFAKEDGTETTTSWRELDDRSTQVARALAAKGLGFGDRLGIRINLPRSPTVAELTEAARRDCLSLVYLTVASRS